MLLDARPTESFLEIATALTRSQPAAVDSRAPHRDTVPTRPTVIIVHPKERRAKCSVLPLRGDPRLEFFKYPRRPADLTNYIQLGMTGPVLSAADADFGLLLLDGTWRYADEMAAQFREVPMRTLPAIETAYPRVSKVRDDPTGGLATVEALYAALRLLGRSTRGLLDQYPFATEFLSRNASLFEACPEW